MPDLGELETRIRVLEDIEAIKKLKARYWRYCDKKLWDELADCFTEDAVAEYGGPERRFESLEAIMKWVKYAQDGDSIITIHQGHNPEIDVKSAKTAVGIWEMFYYMLDKQRNTATTMGAFYEDEYAKENGEWKIRSTKTIPIFIETTNKTAQ